jgi:peptidoglycan/LPS O-acetylase OafA/YrhL
VIGRHRGIGPGFDALRLLLAFYIFYGHTLWIAGGADAMGVAATAATTATTAAAGVVEHGTAGFTGWTRPFHVAAVPVFFALSGFLVCGSAERLRVVRTFLGFRFLRIFPALSVEVALSALLLGPLLTNLPLSQYFTDYHFFRYFGNIPGFVTFELPGVFTENPVKGTVNANLWTLPSEFYCYLVTSALMALGLFFNRTVYLGILAVTTVVLIFMSLFSGFGVTAAVPSPFLITYYFFVGVAFFQWREKIPVDWRIFLACAVIGFGLLMKKELVFLAPIFVTYCTVFFGMVQIPKIPVLQNGDYSYGIYLYGFPIAQALVAIMPLTFIGHGWLLLAVATLLTLIFSMLSWHYIEKPTLDLKKKLPPRFFPVPAKVIPQTPEVRVNA